MIQVLNNSEMLAAAIVGVRRHLVSKSSPSHNKVGNEDYNWHVDIEAACAECAVAKKYNLYWDASVNKFKKDGPDILPDIEVRQSSERWHHLILRDGDKMFCQEYRFIKVVGTHGKYELMGWLHGSEGFKDEYLKDPKGKHLAWFVPMEKLNPMQTFIVLADPMEGKQE